MTAGRFTFRLLTPGNAAIYQAFYVQGLRETPSAFMVTAEDVEEWPLAKLESLLKQPTFAAFSVDKLIGIAALRRYERSTEYHKGRIGPVYIHADWREKGIAKALMQMALEHACQDFEQVTLGVEKENAAARHVYEALGFQPFGTEERAIKIGGRYYDMVQMVKRF